MSSLAAEPQYPGPSKSTGRPTCYRCFRPETLCYCTSLKSIPNCTHVVIVQHPREQFHPINTARMVEGSLERCRVVRGPLRELGARFSELELASDAALLYPSSDAVDLSQIPPDQYPSTVIILDGTWHQAKTLLRDLPELQGLPRVRFTPLTPSEYRIRKEPHAHCLSTLESVALVLGLIEPQLDVTPLGTLFRDVIDRNIAARRPSQVDGRFRWRGRGRSFQLPEAFREPLADAVVVYAEPARFALTEPSGKEVYPLVIVGRRLADGASLCLWLEATAYPSKRLLEHLGQTVEGFESQAISRERASEILARFVAGRRVVSFHPSTETLLRAAGFPPAKHSSLKGPYCDWKRAQRDPPDHWGSLDEICARERLRGDPSTGGRGRPELRLDQTEALFCFLRAQALAEPSLSLPEGKEMGSDAASVSR